MPVPVEYVRERSPLELQGALLLQSKQCRNCHALGGEGGQRGPALDDVATRLTHGQLVRQVLQGGGNMPAYGKNLSPAEVSAIVAFLETMHPTGQLPRATRRSCCAPRWAAERRRELRAREAFLASWSVDPGLVTVLLLLAALYARGWQVLRRQMPSASRCGGSRASSAGS